MDDIITFIKLILKSKLQLFWIRDYLSILKEPHILVEIFNLNVSHINRIDIVGGGYSQCTLWFPIKLICVMNNGNIFEYVSNSGYIHCRKDNIAILKKEITTKLDESFKKFFTSNFI